VIEPETMEKLVGTQFPGGSYTIEPWEHKLICDVLLTAEPANGVAHPLYGYQATRAGMGLSLDEFFALVHANPDDGGMFGEHETEIREPLRVGETYLVRGEITGTTRKEGRKAGVFDMVEFSLELLDQDGTIVATSNNSWMFPRKG
jgi:acyl dehydratase